MAVLESSEIRFNYMVILGNSGKGKTTFAKTLINGLVWDQLYLCDPNRQYADYTNSDNSVYLSPSELKDSLNIIGKKLILQNKKGILIIEDLGLTLNRISETLQVSEKKSKQLIGLLLDNFRKYGVKVIVIAQDIDKDLIGKFDAKVFFQLPLNNYSIKKYSKLLNLDLSEVPNLERFYYILKTEEKTEKGKVEALKSHVQIEKDKGFMVKEILANCKSLAEKILVLRLHIGFSNPQIAQELNIETHTVETEIYRLRKRGIPIPDARRSFRLENLAF